MRQVRLYLDHPRVGCGWRQYLVLTVGPKWARVINIESAETIKIPAAELRHAKDMPLKPARAARLLRTVAKTYGRDTLNATREALAELRT